MIFPNTHQGPPKEEDCTFGQERLYFSLATAPQYRGAEEDPQKLPTCNASPLSKGLQECQPRTPRPCIDIFRHAGRTL